MTLKALCAGLGVLGLLASDALASGSDNGAEGANAADGETLELFISCESSYPLYLSNGETATIRKPPRRPVSFWRFRR